MNWTRISFVLLVYWKEIMLDCTGFIFVCCVWMKMIFETFSFSLTWLYGCIVWAGNGEDQYTCLILYFNLQRIISNCGTSLLPGKIWYIFEVSPVIFIVFCNSCKTKQYKNYLWFWLLGIYLYIYQQCNYTYSEISNLCLAMTLISADQYWVNLFSNFVSHQTVYIRFQVKRFVKL